MADANQQKTAQADGGQPAPAGGAADDVQLLKSAAAGYEQIRQQIGSVIVGQDDIVKPMLAGIFAEGHMLLVGVPGLGKTLLVKTLAHALGWDFRRIQFTPDMMPADVTGTEMLLDSKEGGKALRFMPGPIFANIVLADEINRSPPKTQAALLEAMAEYHVTSMGRTHSIKRPFVVVATQNPIEQEGTYPLPEAQLDRFMLSLWVDYPAEAEEQAMVASTTGPAAGDVGPVISVDQLKQFQSLVRRLPASPHVVNYAVALARATRPQREEIEYESFKEEDGRASGRRLLAKKEDTRSGLEKFIERYVQWGAGPRAAQALILMGKALAVLDGEPTVSAEHVRQAAPWVLTHRIVPTFAATGDGLSIPAIVRGVVRETPEPKY